MGDDLLQYPGAAPASVKPRWQRVEFHGDGMEYFKIWIVNIFLSIITLGIYSAWAKVRTKRYFYGNTEWAGSVFEYHATPMMILKGRLVAFSVFAVGALVGYFYPIFDFYFYGVIALIAPFVIWRSLIFNAKMSSYRNVRFGFEGVVSKLYLYLLVIPLLPVIVLAVVFAALGLFNQTHMLGSPEEGLTKMNFGVIALVGLGLLSFYVLFPLIKRLINSYYFNHLRYGQGLFHSNLSSKEYYLVYLKAIGFSMVIYAVVSGLIFAVMMSVGLTESLSDLGRGRGSGALYLILMGFYIVAMFSFVLIGMFLKAYTTAKLRNYTFHQVRVDEVAKFGSVLKMRRLFWIQLSNLLLLIVTLGLAYPWTKVRLTRYMLTTVGVRVQGSLDDYVSQLHQRQSSLGDEMGDAFDLDLDLGF